ncbi:hypothetical protein MBM_01444 [Drepanopeziza brunnea f. sp. 'multigermtubi' MB_m1]|uniref:Integrase catalytic domain-containing protein n=1 Tax=Marssonina brunnea f. sp. multigermtubi (strain MB_m1) TaxID=1072389 RepID=K1X6N1_MARBU|nr:uncharacterized protein MBM_01444 [Drepanopeziza brunnea f. sp. 'multigermtubi' MB_m1]EKD20762.1 hypothetical protein MBM_01444 [Drepanopeziza brunnea f. sp. 'multigermtubi' MB_m1]
MSPIPDHMGFRVDEEAWERKFDPANTENTTEIVNGYILLMLTGYENVYRYSGTNLRELFQEDFEGWTQDTFALATRICCRNLWRHLLLNGVPIKPVSTGVPYKKVFIDVLSDDKPLEWTSESQKVLENLNKKMESERGAANTGAFSKPLSDLLKIYVDKDKKFGGSDYDVLEDKLLIFYNHCKMVGLPQEPSAYAEALSIMLKDQANTYFYTSLYNRSLGFGEMVNLLKMKFEIEESTQKYLSEWRETTFERTAAQHPEKTKLEALDVMINKLTLLQRNLPLTYHDNKSIRDALLSAFTGEEDEINDSLYTDRTYGGNRAGRGYRNRRGARRGSYRGFQGGGPSERSQFNSGFQNGRGSYGAGGASGGGDITDKVCYVCGKPFCWSTKHTKEERKIAFDKFKRQAYYMPEYEATKESYCVFLVHWEGQLALGIPPSLEHSIDIFHTSIRKINRGEVAAKLTNLSTYYAFTKSDLYAPIPHVPPSECLLNERYDSEVFHGIILDTGAAFVSSAGEKQVEALKKLLLDLKINTPTTTRSIRFGKEEPIVIKAIVDVNTPLGLITFSIVPANTPFLLCLQDMDRLSVIFDNVSNRLIQSNKSILVIRKLGYAFLQIQATETELFESYLSEQELRQIHRRLGHPAARRLIDILELSGNDGEADSAIIKRLTKYCHYCQLHAKSLGLFKFTVKDDHNFNYAIYVDVDTLRACWIDTYLGPLDIVIHDLGTNFAALEFKLLAKSMAVEVKEEPVEAHNSVGKVERYYAMLRRIYDILVEKLRGESVTKEQLLQMAFKAINDTAGPEGFVPTLLVFGAYPRLTELDPPSPSIQKRGEAINKAMTELRAIQATRKVKDALAARNGPDTTSILDLPIQSKVRVWREHPLEGGRPRWTGPWKLIAIDRHTCTVPPAHIPPPIEAVPIVPPPLILPPRRGSRIRRPPRQFYMEEEGFEERFEAFWQQKEAIKQEAQAEAFLTRKELSDKATAVKLRQEGKITTPGEPFQQSQRLELEGLMAREVFQLVQFDLTKHGNTRIHPNYSTRNFQLAYNDLIFIAFDSWNTVSLRIRWNQINSSLRSPHSSRNSSRHSISPSLFVLRRRAPTTNIATKAIESYFDDIDRAAAIKRHDQLDFESRYYAQEFSKSLFTFMRTHSHATIGAATPFPPSTAPYSSEQTAPSKSVLWADSARPSKTLKNSRAAA